MDIQHEPRSIVEIRNEARRLLQKRISSSLMIAGKIFSLAIPSLGVVGGGLIALDMFNFQMFIIFIVLSCVIFLTAFVATEWSRLVSHSEKLKELLTAERSYEILLQNANDERDKARSDLAILNTQHQMALAAQDLIANLKMMILPKEDDSKTSEE